MNRLVSISATLTAALIGCGTDKPNVENPPSPSATAEATSAPSAEATSAPTSAPSAEAAPSATPSAAASAAPAEPGPVPKEAADKMPKDRKFIAGKKPDAGSARTGAGACCAAGSCGSCVTDAKASKRTGKADCCGKGTCGPC